MRISYAARFDILTALVPGEVLDGQLDDEQQVLVAALDADGEPDALVTLLNRGPEGPLIGFVVRNAMEPIWDSEEFEEVWAGPRFDVPTLALRDASIGEIVVAARSTLDGTTPDVRAFDRAVAAGASKAWRRAEAHWRECLALGEMKAHFGLGYTLVELGRPHEAFGHLAMYTEINPRNAWAWHWRAQAAEAMGEIAEAVRCYERAVDAEEEGSYETDAVERLEAIFEEDEEW